MKVLVLGGYGTFGERLCRILAGEPRIDLVVAGRSLAKAEAVRATLARAPSHAAVVADRDGDLGAVLQSIRPDVLVDATGPYQAYGENLYRVVEACLEHGVHYQDFADDADFAAGIAALDGRAKAKGRYALSGVSSFPVLTAAVVRRLAQGLARVRHVRAGIAPSPYAYFGLNVIRAISIYAGRPVALTRGGRASTGRALVETMDYDVSPPGAMPLRRTRFSLAEVPDLQLIPREWPGLESIWVGVGPVPEILHRLLNGLARGVSWRVIPSLAWLAPLFHLVINTVRWGEHRGGMFVEVEGDDAAGAPATRSWHLLAEGDAGPLIPCLAIDAVLRRQLDGDVPAPGARAATHALELDDYAPAFARLGVVTGLRDDTAERAQRSVFRRVLGSAWSQVPPQVQALHGTEATMRLSGEATVTRGPSWLARLVANVVGFPKAGAGVPVEVELRRDERGETWIRSFAGRKFSSRLDEGRGRSARLVRERFGPSRFHMALVPDGDRLRFVVRGWDWLGLPMPRAWAPTGESYETVRDGRFCFHIEVAHPWLGPIVTYDGTLLPASQEGWKARRGNVDAGNRTWP
jgi:hypothetical protein